MRKKAFQQVMRMVPRTAASYWFGKLMHLKIPGPLGETAVERFARFYKINVDEAELPLSEYPTVGDFFIRRLKPGLRPLGEGVVHPAEGEILSSGWIEQNLLVQAKGLTYSVGDLIRDETWAARLDGGVYATTYLCPRDYHRVHCPYEGDIIWVQHIPGDLWPVNKIFAENFPELFVANERVVMALETALGPMVIVMVGATNVGKITLPFDPAIVSNQRTKTATQRMRTYSPPIRIRKGEELGVFNMGSTVVALYGPGMVKQPISPGPCRILTSVEPPERVVTV